MADYKELLRRAVQALPENNGQARRAVYEKARAALVGQLRAITPPLAARDITTHRLQLEDCIRQVEQEASEAVIAGMQEPPPPPAKVQTTQPPKLEARPPGKPQPAPAEPFSGPEPGTIEAIIAAAEQIPASVVPAAAPAPLAARPLPKPESRPEPFKLELRTPARDEPAAKEETPKANGKAGRPLPSIVARAEAAKGKPMPAFGASAEPKFDGGRRAPSIEPRRDSGPRLEPSARGQAAARQQVAGATAFLDEPSVAAAMSSVLEVDVEPQVSVDPQGAIDRAIATLDREARGEAAPVLNGSAAEVPSPEAEVAPAPRKNGLMGSMFGERKAEAPKPERTDRKAPGRRERRPARRVQGRPADAAFPRPQGETERGGINALTIFLTVFGILLVGAGGAGFWAYNEGYLELDSLFARAEPVQQEATAPAADLTPVAPVAVAAEETSGPGNTAAVDSLAPMVEPKVEERLTGDPAAVMADPLPLVPTEEVKTEERLPVESAPTEAQIAEGTAPAVDPASVAGSQSLLLEASDNGSTGAVPFSGTVEWSRGVDETGAPTLIAKANIPARNLGVEMLIRKNSDPSLPASHLMEVNFIVAETFVGGSVAGLPGVLLKNEELVQGAPLVGASARVVGNSFLFALSASPEDTAANNELLTGRKWIDLAIIYATGKRAIITLEKDQSADDLFREVFGIWGGTASAQ